VKSREGTESVKSTEIVQERAGQTDLEETVRRVIGVMGVLFLVAAATAVLALPAGAAGYPPSSCSLQLASGATATAGGSLGVTGTGFASGGAVALSVNGESVGSAMASGSGAINTTITIPSNATSPITVGAAPPGCSLTVALSGAGAQTVHPLAFTGSDSKPLVVAGIVAVALGTVLVFGARRRAGTRSGVEAVSTSV
jgi:hypothetical protein